MNTLVASHKTFRHFLSLALMSIILTACSGGGGGTGNKAPTASNVSITDDNAGDVVIGDVLTGNYTYDDVESDAEGTSTFRWLRDGVAITGETASSYTLDTVDNSSSITFEVTPVAATGKTTGSAVTSSVVTVGNTAPIASNVSISDDNAGNAIVGDVLTGSYIFTDGDGDLEATSTYRWLRDNTVIDGATSLTYTLVAADSGLSLVFEVTPMAATGTATGLSVASGAITVDTIVSANIAPTASSVTITDANGGVAVVGDSLTGSYSYNDVDADPEGTSTFR